jgi:hypothetical protein
VTRLRGRLELGLGVRLGSVRLGDRIRSGLGLGRALISLERVVEGLLARDLILPGNLDLPWNLRLALRRAERL